jgi:phosphatidylglycerophosphatase C
LKPNLALFDFDGTLTTNDAYGVFVSLALPRWRLFLGLIVCWPIVLGYRLGWVSGHVGRATVAWIGFWRAKTAPVERIATTFAQGKMLNLLRPDAYAMLQAHRARGDTVVIVSGSFDLYLAPWCAAHGIELLCSTLARNGERFTGRYAGAQCVGAEKARRVRAQLNLSDYETIFAYGDTADDAELLQLAHRRFYRGVELINGRI